jgi:hypothetical protein
MKGSFIHKMKVVFRATVIQNSRLERRRREASEQYRRELAESYKKYCPTMLIFEVCSSYFELLIHMTIPTNLLWIL